jgi:hypothetical protein
MDFVSYKIAKKLKEKGFRELCLAYYTNNDTLYYNYSHKAGASYTDCYLSHNLMPKDSVSGKFVDAPTISQVLKWLREEKKIEVAIIGRDFVGGPYFPDIFTEKGLVNDAEPYSTYEEAAIAGIDYCLDNLI